MELSRIQFRAKQATGKVRRFIRANFYTKENPALLARREGECTRCGACCKILFKCPFLLEDTIKETGQVQYGCAIYGKYPNQCQLYPLVPKDLEEIEETCGYTFT